MPRGNDPESLLRTLRKKSEEGGTLLFEHVSETNQYAFSVTKVPGKKPQLILRKYFWDPRELQWVVDVLEADSLASLCSGVHEATKLSDQFLDNHIEELKSAKEALKKARKEEPAK